jgi:hypothetical protein
MWTRLAPLPVDDLRHGKADINARLAQLQFEVG